MSKKNTFEKLSIEEFDEQFKPKENHFHKDEGILHFEPYGEEFEYVKSQKRNKIWTIVDGKDGNIYIVKGFNWLGLSLNIVGYVVTKKVWKENKDYHILYHKSNVA